MGEELMKEEETPEEKLKVKQLPEFKDLEILDTWFEDIMRLDDEI